MNAKYEFTITGTTPLLMHADDVEACDRLKKYRDDPQNKKTGVSGDDRSPPWTWMTYVYANGGKIVIPCDNLSTCLREAGAMLVMKGKTTYKQATQSGLMFLDDFFDLLVDGKPIVSSEIDAMQELTFDEQRDLCRELGFELFVKRAKVGTAKHVRVRPRFNQWSLKGRVEVIAPEISEPILRQLFELAGKYKGLCDWRPSAKQSPGRFGMFGATLTKLKE